MSEPRQQLTVRRLIIGGLLLVATLAVALQTIIDSSMQNVASACEVLASAMSILLYIGWTRALEVQPLSTFAIFGFCMTTQLGAMVAQTAAWTPLRSLLYDPLYTYGTLALYQAIAMATHAAYTFLFKANGSAVSPLRRVLGQAGLYRTPSANALWLMGIIGLASFAVSSSRGPMGKVSDAFNFLTWAPFLIPLYRQETDDSYCDARKLIPLLAIYAVIVCLLGVAMNARGIMFLGVVTVGLSYLFIGLRSDAPAKVSRATMLKIGAVAATGLALAGPMSDLATAMAIAREHRGKVSSVELMAETFDAWRRPYLIAHFRAHEKAQVSAAYDENYIANPLLARFIETKFHDNALHFAALLTTEESRARLRAASVASLWAALPAPILSTLRISIDKTGMNFSIMDEIVYLTRGMPLGGYKTGSMLAEGKALAGILFPFVYAGLCLAVFMLMDLLTVRPLVGIASISALGKMQAWPLFIYGISGESLAFMFLFIVRGCFQMMLVYLAVRALVSAVMPGRQGASPRSAGVNGGIASDAYGRKPYFMRGK